MIEPIKKEPNLSEEIIGWLNDNMGNRINQTISKALVDILNKHVKKEEKTKDKK